MQLSRCDSFHSPSNADVAPETPAGAVFGFTTNGTNPDLFVILEARGQPSDAHWYYAAARMTTGGLVIKYEDAIVAEFDFFEPQPKAFPTWTFFAVPRTEFTPRSHRDE
jgi:hypothetical protein